jgi:hypothetical protein
VLAGVGTSWYTWLEQGRGINVSEPIARAIGRALQLDDCQFNYFYRLLGISPYRLLGISPRLAEMRPGELSYPDLSHLVEELLPNPALILDRMWNILESNLATRLVFGLSESEPNLLVSLFTNDVVRSRCADFGRIKKIAVAQFRAGTAECYDDPVFNDLIGRLCERSGQFASLWHSHDVLDLRYERKEVNHPEAGRLVFQTQAWRLDGFDSVRLLLHVPHGMTDTRRKVEALVQSNLGLRWRGSGRPTDPAHDACACRAI